MGAEGARLVFEALKHERLRAGLALEDAARGMGVPAEVLERWESGEEEMRGDDIVRVCRFYGCSPDYLLGLVGGVGVFQGQKNLGILP